MPKEVKNQQIINDYAKMLDELVEIKALCDDLEIFHDIIKNAYEDCILTCSNFSA